MSLAGIDKLRPMAAQQFKPPPVVEGTNLSSTAREFIVQNNRVIEFEDACVYFDPSWQNVIVKDCTVHPLTSSPAGLSYPTRTRAFPPQATTIVRKPKPSCLLVRLYLEWRAYEEWIAEERAKHYGGAR